MLSSDAQLPMTIAKVCDQKRYHGVQLPAVTNVYRASRDLFLAQRFARHVSPLTTTVYTHPSDQEVAQRLRRLTC